MSVPYRTVAEVTLAADEQRALASLINDFGSGSHPYADVESLHFFALAYASQCVEAAFAWLAQHPGLVPPMYPESVRLREKLQAALTPSFAA